MPSYEHICSLLATTMVSIPTQLHNSQCSRNTMTEAGLDWDLVDWYIMSEKDIKTIIDTILIISLVNNCVYGLFHHIPWLLTYL